MIYLTQEEDVKVRIKALEIATDMRPGPVYSGFNKVETPYYNLLEEAESIYQWLLKFKINERSNEQV